MKLYLFKRAVDGIWIYGSNANCEHPTGVCRIIPSTDGATISIVYMARNDANQSQFNIPFGNIYNENGDAYVNFAALKAGYSGFSQTPGSSSVNFNNYIDSHVLALNDVGSIVGLNAGTAKTITVPPNSGVAFPIGTTINLSADGAGQVSVVAGSGVTINSAGSALKLRVQYSKATLVKSAINTWSLSGDIVA